MKTLEIKNLEKINGGDFIDGVCIGIGVSTGILDLANVWNPPGWGLLAVTVACGAYGIWG